MTSLTLTSSAPGQPGLLPVVLLCSDSRGCADSAAARRRAADGRSRRLAETNTPPLLPPPLVADCASGSNQCVAAPTTLTPARQRAGKKGVQMVFVQQAWRCSVDSAATLQ